jgi:hypothetical protein
MGPLAVALALLAPPAGPPRLELDGPVTKVWDAGRHNAFTDLVRFADRWFCAFREADAHVGGDGKLQVLTSADGTSWEPAALLAEPGIDLRDPKLSVTPDGRLMIVAGGSVYDGKTLKGRRPRVAFSADGRAWTATRPVLAEGDWLWRVTWHAGRCYGMSYAAGPGDEWGLTLWAAADGERFGKVTDLAVPGRPNEATVRFAPDGRMVALVRREAGDTRGWVGSAAAPYTDWAWKPLPARVGGPNFVFLPDGSAVAAVRLYDGRVRTSLCRLDPAAGRLDEALALPSGGDTSYAGLVWHADRLWVSYYSSHEGRAAIYLARVKVVR